MTKKAINPWTWSLALGYNQAEIVEGATRQLLIAGQTAVDAKGRPQHENDMRAQMTLALDNLEAVLHAAQMDFTHIAKLGVFTTDVDAALANFDLFGMRMGAVGATPPMTLLGVNRLAMPSLMFEIEASAIA